MLHHARILLTLGCLTCLGLSMSSAQAQTFTGQNISAFANIFGAGNAGNLTPNPGGGAGGTVAPGFDLLPGTRRILTFGSVTGVISFTPGVSTVPDGLMPNSNPPFGTNTNITSFHGISGIRLERGSGFLTGVFLSDAVPTDPAPVRLEFTNDGTPGLISTSFASLSPTLNQTFFVGDGLTGNGSGSTQIFIVPDGATRLFLGYADAYGYNGAPGQYQDNSGSVTVSLTVQPSSVPEPSIPLALLLGVGLSGATWLPRRRRVR